MAGPWEQFAPTVAPEAGPWTKFKPQAPQPEQPQQPAGKSFISAASLEAGPLLEKGQQFLQQREADIDYGSGAPYSIRVGLQRADNPEEAKRYLEKQFGPGNYGQDRFGQWWINQDGKRVAVMPKGREPSEMLSTAAELTGKIGGGMVAGPLGARYGGEASKTLTALAARPVENIAAGMQAQSYPMAGAILGGTAGEVVFPGGGGIPGAIAGAIAGKITDDMIKWAQGLLFQSPTELVKGAAHEGAIAGVFQGAAPAMGAIGRGIRGGLQTLSGVTPTTRAVATRLSGEGAVPPIGAYAPEATQAEYKRQLRNMLSGNPAEQRNVDYLSSRMDQVFMAEGIPDAERQVLHKEIFDKASELSTRQAGEALVGKAKEIHATLANEAEQARVKVSTQLNASDKAIRNFAVAPQSTALDVRTAIKTARVNFSKDMASIYEQIDNMAGNQKIVPTTLIKQQAKELVQVMPPNAVPPLIKYWAEQGAPRRITFQQAHALRSTLREMGETLDVSPTGVRTGNIHKLASATNEAINSTAGGTGQAEALRRADALYKEGIAKFNNTEINRIVRDLRSGIVPDPKFVSSLIMKPDNPELAKTVFKMLPQTTQNNVIKADLGRMIESATRRGANGEMQLDGKSFLRALDDQQPIMQAVYPPQLTATLRRHAADLAAYDGVIDVTSIKTPTAVTNLLEKGLGSMRAADEFANRNPLGALIGGSPQQVDRAIVAVTKPGAEAATEMAARTLGIDSPQWQAVRRHVLQRLFSKSIFETPSLAKTVSGEKISQTLSRYTPRQLELLFPGGLDADLKELARESKFLFPSEGGRDIGTSLAAATIKSGLWTRPLAVEKYIRMRVLGWVYDHPQVLKLLTSTSRQTGPYARSMKGVLMQWITDQALEAGPGRGTATGVPFTAPSMIAKEDQEEPTYGGPQE